MKRLSLSLLVLVFFVFAGCQENANPIPTIVGQWELVSMESGWGLPTILDEDNTYAQSYQFNTDGTFVKTRIQEGQSEEASGTYYTAEEDQTYSDDDILNIVLEFSEGKELAESCGSAGEFLILRNNTQLKNSWDMCDGPGLVYGKK